MRQGKKIMRTLLFQVLLFVLAGGISASAQVGTNGLFCPAVPFTEGMLNLNITPSVAQPPDFSTALVGTFERTPVNFTGGLDWMPARGATGSVATTAPTNEMGTQLIGWWSRKDGRNTNLQVTNTSSSTAVEVHVHILNEDCVEIRDFCDVYTPRDTHVYDLSSLTTNSNQIVATGNLAGVEGIIVVTPVDDCTAALGGGNAIDHDFMTGQISLSDSFGFTYGTNMFARQAICTGACTGVLTGDPNSKLDTYVPDETFGLFNTVGTETGSDAVVINLQDIYTFPYRPVAAFSVYDVAIFDDNENEETCGAANLCFTRLGVDQSMPRKMDADGDGIPDNSDNCPDDANPGQEDGDADGFGDACDTCSADPDNDIDGDSVCGDVDNCPTVPNPGQEDVNMDGFGDACVSPDATIGGGVTIGENVMIGEGARIRNGVTLGDNVVVGNNVRIQPSVNIGDGVVIGEGTTIGPFTTIGANTVIGNNVSIGSFVVIGENVTIGDGVRIRSRTTVPDGSVIN